MELEGFLGDETVAPDGLGIPLGKGLGEGVQILVGDSDGLLPTLAVEAGTREVAAFGLGGIDSEGFPGEGSFHLREKRIVSWKVAATA